MKALRPALFLFILSLFVVNNITAQKASFTSPGGLTIGFGAGYAYQKSDLANSMGYGFDFIFGSKLYQKENAFLSVDWRFRFLAGVNKAYDHRINPDDTYSNIRYNFFNYDLEVGLTLNRLRERTRIILSGFAGVGITHGRTFTDLYDAGNNLYDYSGIDPDRDKESVYNDLVTLSDGDFETRLVNKAALLPTAGLYLGYQFTRSFSLGVEFKTNFCLTETNSFAGIDTDHKVITGSGIDRNNYVSLGFRWRMGRGSSRSVVDNYSSGAGYTYSNPPVSGGVAVVTAGSQPSVRITLPDDESVHTTSPVQTIKATIQNVDGVEDISFIQNGFPNNSFTYNASTQSFIGNVTLREGENLIRIKASNQLSSAEDLVLITRDNPMAAVSVAPVVVTTPPVGYVGETGHPMVRFLQPAAPVEVREHFFRLSAETQNVFRKNDITLLVNDAEIHNFAFADNGIVSVSLFLAEGYNTMEIIASNEAGSASDWTSVIYRKPVYTGPLYQQPGYQQPVYRDPVTQPVHQEPIVQQPEYRPPVTQEPVAQQPVSRPPQSEEPVDRPCRMPVIRLLEPVQDQGSTDQASCTFRAEVLNVHGNQLRLSSNGKPVTFNLNNNILSSSVPLVKGSNTILLSAVNACGEEKVSARMNYVPPVDITPCTSPTVSFTLQQVQRNDATHELRGSVTGVKTKADISITLDGAAYNGFQFNPASGILGAKFKFTPGSHTVLVTVNNACGTDSKSGSVSLMEEVEEEACGIRINPGNSDWQFCLVTPSGTFNRENLSRSSFSYSGPARSIYFMPIGGGGTATVRGNPYPIRSGQYYLFSGNLQVSVSTSNPGSMGHWSVCITADREPSSGNGNNRPQSPCASQSDDKSKGQGDDKSKGQGNDKSKGQGNDNSKGQGNANSKGQGNANSKSQGNDPSKGQGNNNSKSQGNDRSKTNNDYTPRTNDQTRTGTTGDQRTNRSADDRTQRKVKRR